jgi:hypothetical protein
LKIGLLLSFKRLFSFSNHQRDKSSNFLIIE